MAAEAVINQTHLRNVYLFERLSAETTMTKGKAVHTSISRISVSTYSHRTQREKQRKSQESGRSNKHCIRFEHYLDTEAMIALTATTQSSSSLLLFVGALKIELVPA